MTTYLPRSAWTSTAVGGSTLTGSELVGVAIHYPGSGNVQFGVESQSKVAERLRGWRNWHVNGRGWSDIGYNFAIDQAGRVWMLRSTQWRGNRVGAHSASSGNPRANHHRVGVLFVLGNNEQPSAAMIRAFQDWRWGRFLAGWPGRTDIRGHRQVPGAATSCPGNPVVNLINNGTLAKNVSTPPPPPPPPPPEDELVAPSNWTAADRQAVREAIFGDNKFFENLIVKHTDKNIAWHLRTIVALLENMAPQAPSNPKEWDADDVAALREALFGSNRTLNNVVIKHTDHNLAWHIRTAISRLEHLLQLAGVECPLPGEEEPEEEEDESPGGASF